MDCEWVPNGLIYKCKNCGFINKIGLHLARNCSVNKPQRQQGGFGGTNDIVEELGSLKQPPSTFRRFTNFTFSSIKHFLKGNPTCTQEQIDERLEICKSCELYRKQSEEVGICAHESCGCNLKALKTYLNKLAWCDQSCPENKWGPIE